MSLFSTEDSSINNLLNKGSFIRGNVRIAGFIRIDGDLDGNLECSGDVVIGEKARVKGNITARAVTISGGIVCGDIWAPESVHLFSSSVVLGDVQTHSFMADSNVIFNGHCISLKDEASYTSAAERWQNTKAITAKAKRAGI